MKSAKYFLIPFVAFMAACAPHVYVATQQPPPSPPPAPVEVTAQPVAPPNSYQVFYDALGPYGRWIYYPGEGYVWVPNLGPDFRPYATNGHWVYSDAGWTWVSGYNWGWAPFHYGRWFFEAGYGWMWLPGHQWAPAWVTWGRSGNYYGWAPVAPHIKIEEHSWTPPESSWTFVPAEHITHENVVNYAVNNKTVINNTTIVKNVTVINNITNNKVVNNNVTNNVTDNNVTNKTTNVVYNRGPEVNEVENVSNIKIQKVTINEKAEPGAAIVNANKLMVYRPVIKQTVNSGERKPAPVRVEQYHKAGQ